MRLVKAIRNSRVTVFAKTCSLKVFLSNQYQDNLVAKEVQVWVCPHCDVLQGIDVEIGEDNNFITNCVNCGVRLQMEEVHFLDPELTRKVMEDISGLLPDDFPGDIIFRWSSNKTIGIVIEGSQEEFAEYADIDTIDILEDDVAPRHGVSVTVFFSD